MTDLNNTSQIPSKKDSKKRKQITATMIQKMLSQAKFNPQTPSQKKLMYDVGNSTYYEHQAMILIQEAAEFRKLVNTAKIEYQDQKNYIDRTTKNKLQPMSSDIDLLHDREKKANDLLTKYEQTMILAIQLLVLAMLNNKE